MKHKKLLGVVLMFTGMFLYNSCSKMAPAPQDTHGGDSCIPRFPNENVTYENYVKNILSKYCTVSCHNGGGVSPGNFSTYEGVLPYISQFQFRVIQDKADMPQGNAPLPKSVRDSLNFWIQNCAPQN